MILLSIVSGWMVDFLILYDISIFGVFSWDNIMIYDILMCVYGYVY